MLDWRTILLLLAYSHTAHFWTLGNVKDGKGRLFPPVTANIHDDDQSEYLQDWLNEEIDLQRRADEELQAAEIASAEEEYERIKYNIELQRRNGFDPDLGDLVKRAGLDDVPELSEGVRSENSERLGAAEKRSGTDGGETEVENDERADEDEDGVERQRKEIEPKMGIPNKFCDDAKLLLENDWDPMDRANAKDYTCNSSVLQPTEQSFKAVCVRPKKPTHVCMRRPLEKQSEPPVLGPHRPLWAKYGKYLYLPWQRWLHNLEHGAIGLLYHKCADPDQLELFENMVTNCLRKHVITPYELPPDKPFALVSWGCYLHMTHFDKKVVFNFIKKHALHGRENFVRSNGQYGALLVQPAKLASDYKDSQICPKKRFPDMYDKLTGLEYLKDIPVKQSSPRHHIASQKPHKSGKQRHKRDADWLGLTNQNTGSEDENDSDWSELTNGNLTPELAKEGDILKLEEEEGMADVEREAKIAELEKEEDIARLERQSDIAHLQRDLHAIKKLFHQKVKPLMRN